MIWPKLVEMIANFVFLEFFVNKNQFQNLNSVNLQPANFRPPYDFNENFHLVSKFHLVVSSCYCSLFILYLFRGETHISAQVLIGTVEVTTGSL